MCRLTVVFGILVAICQYLGYFNGGELKFLWIIGFNSDNCTFPVHWYSIFSSNGGENGFSLTIAIFSSNGFSLMVEALGLNLYIA